MGKLKLDEIWNKFEETCTNKSPYDLMIWKKIWLDHFSENYNFEYVFNTNFFLPIKFRDFEGSIIGDKDIVDYADSELE